MSRYAGRVSSNGREARPSGVFIPGATSAQANEIQAAALLPEGSLVFRLEAGPLYEQPGFVTVVEIPSGATLLRLVRDGEQNLVFTHATPGTGTRVAVLPLPSPVEAAPFVIVLSGRSQQRTSTAALWDMSPRKRQELWLRRVYVWLAPKSWRSGTSGST